MTSSGTLDTTKLVAVILPDGWGGTGTENNNGVGDIDIMGGTSFGGINIQFGFNAGTDASAIMAPGGPFAFSNFSGPSITGSKSFTTYSGFSGGVRQPGVGIVASDIIAGQWTPNQNWTYAAGASFASQGLNPGTYAVSDSVTGETITIQVGATGSNTPPVAVDDPNYVTLEDVILNEAAPGVLGNDTDAENDPLTAALDSTTSNGSLTLNADGSFDYDPDPNFCGQDSFTYHANDGEDDSNVATATITVTCVNDAPVAVDNNYSGDEDNQISGNVIVDDTGEDVDFDVDGDGMTIFSNTNVAHGTLVLNTDGSFTYDPNLNYCGPDSFDYVITDDPSATPPSLTSNTATVSLTVVCVNDPPTVTSVVPDAQTSDYSDNIGTVIITVLVQ